MFKAETFTVASEEDGSVKTIHVAPGSDGKTAVISIINFDAGCPVTLQMIVPVQHVEESAANILAELQVYGRDYMALIEQLAGRLPKAAPRSMKERLSFNTPQPLQMPLRKVK